MAGANRALTDIPPVAEVAALMLGVARIPDTLPETRP